MLNALYEKLSEQSNVAIIIISVSLMLLCGFLMTRITKKLRLPNVTAYIVVGILIGPFCLNLVPQNIIKGTEFLADIALAFIAFICCYYFTSHNMSVNINSSYCSYCGSSTLRHILCASSAFLDEISALTCQYDSFYLITL